MRESFIGVAAVLVASCGGSTFTPAGDASTDAGGDSSHDGVDAGVDVPGDPVPPDGPMTACTEHLECLNAEYCGPCGFWSCPCDPEEDPGCSPRCMPNPCHDGSDPVCPMPPPDCAEFEVLTVVGGCFECLNIETCRPWGEPGCTSDADCPPEDYCDSCASSSCPGCEDCVSGCLPHGCPTEAEAFCDMIRPDCGPGAVGVVRGGCWVCVDMSTCEPIDGGG